MSTSILPLELQVLEGRIPLSGLAPTILLCLSRARTGRSNDIYRDLLCIQLFEVRGNCLRLEVIV